MGNSLLELLGEGDDQAPQPLVEIRLGDEPAMVMLFTHDVDTVQLHYESDPAVRSYVLCPGKGCPACHLGSSPKQYYLLAVYSVEDQRVGVIRISDVRTPDALATRLLPFLQDDDIAKKVLFVSRNGAKYTVEARPLAEHAYQGEREIEAFEEQRKNGLDLSTAFLRLAPAEYADVERIRRKLDAVGGYEPPKVKAKPK